ncbi:MAG TPA: L,D-transpeptidase [Acidimicrobiales bacterium]|nr:L,D-transpeptidase [Acidimicrobiales bacterium]
MLIVVVAAVVFGLSRVGGAPPKHVSTPTTTTRSRPPSTTGIIPPTFTVSPSALIATLHGSTPSYASSTAPSATGSVLPAWSGATLGLPVIGVRHGRCHIRLLQRPNNLTAWVATSDVTLTHTDYHVVVVLSANRLVLYRRSKVVLVAPAVVGSAQYPTPTGHFFVALLAQAPNPTYGPFVIVTSAFATTVTDWEQGGSSMVAISGPVDTLAAIEHGGAPLSHAGIRLSDSDLARLRPLPAGTPIDVVTTLIKPVRHHRAAPVG